MKFVQLYSGGKDSCYSMMECIAEGHEVVCLAHLAPPADQEEIDSFMFQSAGHSTIELIAAECLDLPLVRRVISGKAIDQGITYSETSEDEVEDLFELLAEVQRRFPELGGVSCGAIFSTYQRNRVEHVCARLGLTSLNYLWRRRQTHVLPEMLERGVEAVLVKVCSMGLLPRRHLGRPLAELQPHFELLRGRYKFHVCGEGGEYETLTLDCPLFKRRLVLDATSTIVLDDDPFAPVALLRVDSCHTEEKAPAPLDGAAAPPTAGAGASARDAASGQPAPSAAAAATPPTAPGAAGGGARHEMRRRCRVAAIAAPHTRLFSQAGMRQLHGCGVHGCNEAAGDAPLSIEDEMARAMAAMREALAASGFDFADVAFVHLWVSDLSLFARINAVYCQSFGSSPPPASRSCVQVDLSEGCRVALDFFAVGSSSDPEQPLPSHAQPLRSALHVRSVSRWAPVCIGPYSQANVLGNTLVMLAGQIALDAPSMDLVSGDVAVQTRTALANNRRVLGSLRCGTRSRGRGPLGNVIGGVLFIGAEAWPSGRSRAASEWVDAMEATRRVVLEAHRDDSAGDAAFGTESDYDSGSDEGNVEASIGSPALLCVVVPALPRGAAVELEMVAVTDRVMHAREIRCKSISAPDERCAERSQAVFDAAGALCMLKVSVGVVPCGGAPAPPDGADGPTDHPAAIEEATLAASCSLVRCLRSAVADAASLSSRFPQVSVYFAQQSICESTLRIAVAESWAEQADAEHDAPALSFIPVLHLEHGMAISAVALAHDVGQLGDSERED